MKQFICLVFLLIGSLTQAQLAPEEVKHLIFEGAGIRGVAYVGAHKQLNKMGVLEQLEGVGGTSAGALTALLVATGYDPNEVEEILFNLNLDEFNDGAYLFAGGINRLSKDFGWYKTESLQELVEQFLTKKGFSADISFKELHEQSGMDLRVAVTRLNHQEARVLGVATYPNMEVADAVLASMSIPLYFSPVIFNEAGERIEEVTKASDFMAMDGGILMNFPIGLFDEKESGKVQRNPCVLGIRVDTQDQFSKDVEDRSLSPQNIEDLPSYLNAFYVLVLESINRQDLTEDDWLRTVRINCGNQGPKIKELTLEQKQALVKAGEEAVKVYFK